MKRLPALLVLITLLLTGCGSAAPAVTGERITEGPEEIALALSEKYQVQILVGTDAASAEPWDYSFTPEEDSALLLAQLETVDQCLRNYPEGMLKVLADDCGGLTICLVKKISGKENNGGLTSARGLQFRDRENQPYLAIAEDLEYTLYHELTHVIEDFVLPRSQAWDQWEDLNPLSFDYDMDFEKNLHRDGSMYLGDANRCFIDTYSMSFPREDRARIMEYAMTEGNRSLFSSPMMQEKLNVLSMGIREAFSLTDSRGSYCWEQYLMQ